MGKHLEDIDEFDLNRIVKKIRMLENIIDWLVRLRRLDDAINQDDLKKALSSLRYKKSVLEKKYRHATKELTEQALLIAEAYKD